MVKKIDQDAELIEIIINIVLMIKYGKKRVVPVSTKTFVAKHLTYRQWIRLKIHEVTKKIKGVKNGREKNESPRDLKT